MAQATRDAEVAPPHSKNHLDMVPPTEPAVLHDSTLRVASYGARAAALPTLVRSCLGARRGWGAPMRARGAGPL